MPTNKDASKKHFLAQIHLFQTAVCAGDLETTKQLFAIPGLYDAAVDKKGVTGLIAATLFGQFNVVSFLLPHLTHQQITSTDDSGSSALLFASQQGYFEIIEALLKHLDSHEIFRPNRFGETALLVAARMGDAKCMKLLLKRLDEKQVRDHGVWPLIDAIWNQHADIVKLLVDAGIDQKGILTPYKGSTPEGSPIFHAIMRGNPEITRLLLSKQAPTEKIDIALFEKNLLKAIEVGSMDAFEYFLPYIPLSELCAESKLQNDRNPYLMAAINHNQVAMVERLLKEGIPAGDWHYHYYHEWFDETFESSPALFTAAQKGYVKIVKLLLKKVSLAQIGHYMRDSQHDPSYDQCCSEYLDGTTALMAAAQNGHIEVVSLLLDTGLTQEQILYKDRNFKTALDLAATEEIRQLIQTRINELKIVNQ